MATDAPTMPVNGNYAPHQGFGSIDPQQNNYAYSSNAAVPQLAAAQVAPAAAPAPSSQQADIPKDEVGWYFVEQYYTTLSRSPEKLYLFYNKRSQFVSGQETDKVQVCVGQRAINDRIKELDFNDCKVRVTNVDSQASDQNIVIQVVGEISNKSQPHKKFTQTFVLATQTNGYFVLNDIFRYLIEEEDDREPQQAHPQQQQTYREEVQQGVPGTESGYQEPVHTATEAEAKILTSSSDQAAIEQDAQQVDKELEDKVIKEQEPPKVEQASEPALNGVPAQAETEKISAVEPEQAPAAETQPETQSQEAEKPKAPEPTPRASPPKQAPAQPAPAPKASVPKTWASLAASANRAITPAVPSSITPPAQQRPAPSTAKSATSSEQTATPSSTAVPTGPAAAQAEDSPATPVSQDEWTAVGGSHNRQQSRQTAQPEPPQSRGYIKAVHDNIDSAELKAHLEKFGDLVYFDIARQKNCAFVDFKTPEGYKAAVAANPHKIGSDELNVEERRVRPSGFVPRGQYQGRGRGGMNQGPRGSFQGSRGGSFGGPRGGRGGAPAGAGAGAARGGRGGATQAA